LDTPKETVFLEKRWETVGKGDQPYGNGLRGRVKHRRVKVPVFYCSDSREEEGPRGNSKILPNGIPYKGIVTESYLEGSDISVQTKKFAGTKIRRKRRRLKNPGCSASEGGRTFEAVLKDDSSEGGGSERGSRVCNLDRRR